MKPATLTLWLVAGWAATAPAQERPSPTPAQQLWLETWAGARANDVLTGWTDLRELATVARTQSRGLAESSRYWADKLAAANRMADGALHVSPADLARAPQVAAQRAAEAERLAALSRELRSHPGAGRFGSWLGKWGTPIAAMAGAAGSLWEGDWIGASQDLFNGAGSMKATALGAAAGLYLGGPWGALIGGIAGNVAYSLAGSPVVSGLADRLADARSGPDAEDRWAAAEARISAWTNQAGELAGASRDLLLSAGPPGVDAQLQTLDAELGALGSSLDRLTGRRLQLCAASRPPFAPLLTRFRAAVGDALDGLEPARAFEQLTCSTLDRMRGSPESAAQVRDEYLAGGGSVPPPAPRVREALAAAERTLEQVREADAGLERWRREAAAVSDELAALGRRTSALRGRAESYVAETRLAEERLLKAEVLRDQAAALLERARLAAGRHALQHEAAVGNAPLVALGRINAERDGLPAASDFSAGRQRLAALRGRLDFLLSEAGELLTTLGPAAEAAAACTPESVDLAGLDRSLTAARARAEALDQMTARTGQCRAEIERGPGPPRDPPTTSGRVGASGVGSVSDASGSPGAQVWVAVDEPPSRAATDAGAALVRQALAVCDFPRAVQFLAQVEPAPLRESLAAELQAVRPGRGTFAARLDALAGAVESASPAAIRQAAAAAMDAATCPGDKDALRSVLARAQAEVQQQVASHRDRMGRQVAAGQRAQAESAARWRALGSAITRLAEQVRQATAAGGAPPGTTGGGPAGGGTKTCAVDQHTLSMCRNMESRDRNGVILHWVFGSGSGSATTWGFLCQPRDAPPPSGAGLSGPYDTPDQALSRVPANCR